MKIICHFTVFILLVTQAVFVQAQDLGNLKNQKPFKMNGTIELRGLFYQATGIQNRMEPFNFMLSGSPTISLYGWDIPFSFVISKKQSSFQQPFNQFGLSPTYKWLTLHAGYRNVTFSPYTLAGHTMLGGGVEANPGKFRLGFMYGRLNKATVIDTTNMSLIPFSFTRKGLAAKLGYGTVNNFFDINFLHAKDDSTSNAYTANRNVTKTTPAANTVLGYGTKITLFRKFFFESDGAISLLTRDMNSPLVLDSITDPTLRKLGDFLAINGSSEWFMAFAAGAGYSEKDYTIKVNYRRVEPGFMSMGAYYFTNDIENITLSPSYNHPKGYIRVNASLGLEQDNVRLQKDATSRRVIAAGTLSSEITANFGVDINFSNFSTNQRPNTLKFADSLKIVQTTRTIGFMPRYTRSNDNTVQLLLLSANFNKMDDYNSYFDNTGSAPSRDINSSQYLVNYTLSLIKKRITLTSSLSYTDLNSAAIKNNYTGVSAGASYMLADRKLTAGTNLSYMLGQAGGSTSNIFNGSLNLAYNVRRNHTLRALLYFTNNNPGSVITGANPAFSETRGEIAYQLNFGL